MMPQIDNITGQTLSPEAEQVLRRIFARYKRIVITREFNAGLSGSRVFEVRPVKSDGTPELPTVVKLATLSMIRQEWRAYQNHIHNRLPHVASATTRPTLVADTGWGGLRYPMVASTTSEVVSLERYVMLGDVTVAQLETALERLVRIMDNVWSYGTTTPAFVYQHSYNSILPPNLVLQPDTSRATRMVMTISLDCLPSAPPQQGARVALRGFAVRKVDAARRTVSLRLPPAPGRPAFDVRLRLPADAPLPDYHADQVIDLSPAQVLETRFSRLHAELALLVPDQPGDAAALELAPGVWFANPLAALDTLLERARSVHVATVHGDFNLENILIEPCWGDISLIDFAEAREDHVLHDLLHLEAEVVTKLLPAVVQQHQLDPLVLLAELSRRLHRVLRAGAEDVPLPAIEGLRKPWVLLRAIRLAARRYLFDSSDVGEYYQGLALYLLGTLRYRQLDQRPDQPLPKRLAFYAASLAYAWLLHTGDDPPAVVTALLGRARALWRGDAAPVPQPHPSRRTSPTPAQLAPAAGELPLRGGLPPGSRMPFDFNGRFVGRREQLARLAALVSNPATNGGLLGAPVVAITGLGGIGKTQLAIEFAYRYGRFFSGGVYWLSCADPATVPAEIAACAGPAAMNLRPHIAELPLEEQVRLVLAEWEKPAPRLLILDNCESPELLARWRPRTGGSHVLVTSRRPDWQAALGLPVLALDVLQRAESLALLTEHQPDADRTLLDAIAHELGDLPLAIHLAGSYLARYRHTTNAAGYLASLRHSSPLRHQSMQGGPLLPTEHDVHVARTFAVSYDQLGRDEPSVRLARTLFHCLSCVAPGEPIPEALLRLALEARAGAAEAVRAGVYLGGALSQLLELGLVSAQAHRTIVVHRLVRAFTRDRLGDAIGPIRNAVERALCEEAQRINARRDPASLRQWQVHLRFLADAALSRGDVLGADLCHALAEHLYQAGDYRGAAGYYEHALAIRRNVLGSDHQATARTLAQLGKILFYAGEPERARLNLELALAIQRTTLGPHVDTATTLNHLGFLRQNAGELDGAQECHTEALHIRRNLLGDTHPALVDSLANLAYVDFLQGKIDAAHHLLQQALVIQRTATGHHHPETARLLTNLGELLLAQERMPEAETVLNEALAIQQQELGEHHPDTARTLGNLGDARRATGDGAQARVYYEHALQVFLACHGADHARTQWVSSALDALAGH
jgi:tetratricopeptide (TPR) repeat protein